MFKFFRTSTSILFIPIAVIYGNFTPAQAEPNKIINRIEQYSLEGKEDSINQITNVNQLRDVSPTDWSYEGLKSLTEHYSCIFGLPDGTFKGDRPMTRNEFAAGLNSCFEQIERSLDTQKQISLISIFLGNTRIFIEKDGSIDTITAERNMIESDLATVNGNTDELESRTIKLEDKQFSTTTKLTGETIFNFSDTFKGF